MNSLSRIAAAVMLANAATSSLPAAPPRTPTEKWLVEFAENQCVASRNYGSPDKPLIVVLKPSPLGNVLQLSLAHRDMGSETREVPAQIQIDDDPVIQTAALAYDAKRAKLRFIRINMPAETSKRLARANTLSITSKGEVSDRFALSQMRDLMTEMDTCLADLQRYWNIGAPETVVRARAKADLAKYFKSSDYPELAVLKDKAGVVEFALLVTEAGRVADCIVTATSNVPVLDAQSCVVLQERARFTPAVGADGKPVKDGVVGRVRWMLP